MVSKHGTNAEFRQFFSGLGYRYKTKKSFNSKNFQIRQVATFFRIVCLDLLRPLRLSNVPGWLRVLVLGYKLDSNCNSHVRLHPSNNVWYNVDRNHNVDLQQLTWNLIKLYSRKSMGWFAISVWPRSWSWDKKAPTRNFKKLTVPKIRWLSSRESSW